MNFSNTLIETMRLANVSLNNGPNSRSEEQRRCGREKTAALRLEKERMDVYWTKLGSPKWKSC
jgi:hypothetical protein